MATGERTITTHTRMNVAIGATKPASPSAIAARNTAVWNALNRFDSHAYSSMQPFQRFISGRSTQCEGGDTSASVLSLAIDAASNGDDATPATVVVAVEVDDAAMIDLILLFALKNQYKLVCTNH